MSDLVENLGGWPAVIGYILGIVGICATILVYYLTRISKTLDWQILTAGRMVAAFTTTVDVKVLVNDSVLSNPNIVALTIRNTGAAAIAANEWDGPIEIQFTKSVVESVEITDRSSPRVGRDIEVGWAVFESGQSAAFIRNIGLLNRGEWFAVQLITDGEEDAPVCTARFAGQTRGMKEVTPVSLQFELSPGMIAGLLGEAALAALPFSPRRRR